MAGYVGTARMRRRREDASRRTTIIGRPDTALPDRAGAVTGPGGGGNTTFPGRAELYAGKHYFQTGCGPVTPGGRYISSRTEEASSRSIVYSTKETGPLSEWSSSTVVGTNSSTS